MATFRPRPTKRARSLRNNSTEAERHLWSAIRNRQLANAKFSRQIPLGPYICDFVSRELRVVIEVDGGHHALDARDADRTAYLEGQGFRVLRFWNNEIIENLEGVVDTIRLSLPTPAPPASGRGSK
jgi:very-short-patch-repair endonuclease